MLLNLTRLIGFEVMEQNFIRLKSKLQSNWTKIELKQQ